MYGRFAPALCSPQIAVRLVLCSCAMHQRNVSSCTHQRTDYSLYSCNAGVLRHANGYIFFVHRWRLGTRQRINTCSSCVLVASCDTPNGYIPLRGPLASCDTPNGYIHFRVSVDVSASFPLYGRAANLIFVYWLRLATRPTDNLSSCTVGFLTQPMDIYISMYPLTTLLPSLYGRAANTCWRRKLRGASWRPCRLS